MRHNIKMFEVILASFIHTTLFSFSFVSYHTKEMTIFNQLISLLIRIKFYNPIYSTMASTIQIMNNAL